jgi:hypothetical protein
MSGIAEMLQNIQNRVWHNYKGKSRVVMQFGDGTEAYRFPMRPESDPFWQVAPDPTNAWW